MVKKILFSLIVVLGLVSFLSVKPAQAWTEWSNYGSCQPITCGSHIGYKTKTCVVSKYNIHQCTLGDTSKTLCYVEHPTKCEEPTPTPSVAPCTENCGNPPTFAGSSTEAPVCSDGSTTSVVANPHVVRSGTMASVNFFITEGNSANIYYKEVGAADWQHAVSDVKPNGDNFVSYTVHDLDANLGYTFGIQQKVGCGGGQIVTSVIVDDPISRTFNLSYYSW